MLHVPLAKPLFTPTMREAAVAALENEKFVLGESVFKFEEEFARAHGAKHAVAVASGTLALELTLEALGLSGKTTLTTPQSFIATANAVLRAGGTPRFADIGPDGNLDPAKAAARSDGAAALLPVHLYGTPFDAEGFRAIAEARAIPLIEDACQAHGARTHGRSVGSLGRAAVFSFYPSKNMTVGGDGGMVTTQDEALAALVRKSADCGRVTKYEHDVLGTTARLNTVNAAIGRVQLRELPAWNAERRRVAQRYSKGLEGVGDLELPLVANGTEPVHHMFVVRTHHREGLSQHLRGNGVETGIHYPIPIHLQPLYRARFGFREGDFPVAEAWSRMALSLPMFPTLPDSTVDAIVDLVRAFFAKVSA